MIIIVDFHSSIYISTDGIDIITAINNIKLHSIKYLLKI